MARRSEEALPNQVAVRLSDEDMARLDALGARLPIVSRNAIVRAAMRLGLDTLEANPMRIVEPPPKRGRKPR